MKYFNEDTYDLSSRLRAIRDDATLNALLDDYIIQPKLLKKVDFTKTLASELGVRGYAKEAILLNKKVLKKHPQLKSIHVDLAVMYGQIGDEKSKRIHFEQVPVKAQSCTAYANLLNDLGYRDKAIACYEKLCRQDKERLYLTFTNLALMYNFYSQERLYWLSHGFINHSSEIGLVLPYAISVFATGDLQKVIDIDLNIINSHEVHGVIKNDSICHKLSVLADLQKICTGIIASKEEDIIKSGKILASFGSGYGCEPVKSLLKLTSPRGMVDSSRHCFDILCSKCQETISLPDLMMSTAICSRSKSSVYSIFNEYEGQLSSYSMLYYASTLDDFDETETALEYLSIQDFFETKPLISELEAKYDGYFYALKCGKYELAKKLIEEVCSIPTNDVIETYAEGYDAQKTCPPGHFNDLIAWREVNNFVAKLITHNLDDALVKLAQIETLSLKGTYTSKNDPYNDFTLVFPADFIESLRKLFYWCQKNSNSANFSSELIKKITNNENLAALPKIGGLKPKITSKRLDLKSLLTRKNNWQALNDWRLQAIINEDKGDHSHIINSLRKIIPGFSILSDGAKTSLIDAEKRFLDPGVGFDITSTIHSYCKALEIDLRERFFSGIRDELQKLNDFATLIEQAKKAKNFSQFSSIIRFFDRGGFIELGGMVRCLKFTIGKTSKSVTLFQDIQQILILRAPYMLESLFIDRLEIVTNDLRNPSAHDTNLGINSLDDSRKSVGWLLNKMTSLRIIP